MTIRVLLADDQTVIRAGFRVLVDRAPDLEVVGRRRTAEKRSNSPPPPEPT